MPSLEICLSGSKLLSGITAGWGGPGQSCSPQAGATADVHAPRGTHVPVSTLGGCDPVTGEGGRRHGHQSERRTGRSPGRGLPAHPRDGDVAPGGRAKGRPPHRAAEGGAADGAPTCSGRAPGTGPDPCRSTSSGSRGRPAGPHRSRVSPTHASCWVYNRSSQKVTEQVTSQRPHTFSPRTRYSRAQAGASYKAGSLTVLV